ncbi:DUF3526 domain-containing protein [Polaribacter cellanae]|uniref:DUF3526 domain-containing protein n=1 Tax=Polaribacter cellanae TaxID=2818493 RepID=A0A975CNR7_9FLAO|nr:DUF3526 domain-containing protein [Polaribacter cellanae]QTE22714.1 DUF3526 domain-containing protein [Polaribacter cellanae]
MKLILLLWQREGISIIRNTFQIIILSTIFLLGTYAIYYGYSKITEQQKTINNVQQIEKEEFESYKESFYSDHTLVKEKQLFDIASKPAYAWYRHGYHAILNPHSLAHMSLGQRDIEPYYYKLTGTSLYYQLFQIELANPLKLYAGNFDLSFVLIYLFPLLIIAFTYGLYAEEKENGMLPLLRLQTIGLRKILLIRIGFYYVLIVGSGILLSSIGFLVSRELEVLSIFLWISAILCYFSFWFALMFLLISLKKNSSLTAISAASLWLLFLIVLPAVLNVYANLVYPIDNTSIADVTRRRSLENEDDLNEAKAVVLEYLQNRNDLKEADSLIGVNTMAKAYAAFTALNDNHHRKEVSSYFYQVRRRQKKISLFRWANPAVNTQGILNEIVETDSGIFQSFYQSIESFHKGITSFYFDKLFLNQEITKKDYETLPEFNLNIDVTTRNHTIRSGLMEILVTTFLLFGISLVLFNKTTF